MRPAGRGETSSLYFDYPHFDAPDPSERGTNAPVLIVGAGPIGLTAALALAKEGIASVVFDNKATFNDGSRAICVARPSYYILSQINAITPFLKKALPWTTGRTFFRDKQILEFQMPDSADEKYRPMYNIQQQFIEQFLFDAADASNLINVRWQSEVTNVADTDAGVRVTITDPHGDYTADADWLLACDGARSTVRKMRGHRLQGENYGGRYVIADIRMDHDYPTIRRALFDPKNLPGMTVLIHKQPDNIWRIDYQIMDGADEGMALSEDEIRAKVSAVLKDIGYDGSWKLEWWSIYSANTLALDDYRDGHVFFVGDSAHIVPIFGVRGLNNGLADAANIGWKLGWVLNEQAGETLLDSYTPERRGATLDVFANASKSARFMTPNTHGFKVMRDAALSLALAHPFAGELANPRQMTAFAYSESPAILPDDPSFCAEPYIGALMPDAEVNDGFLSDRLGKGFTVLCFDADLAQQIKDKGVPPDLLHVVTVAYPSSVADKFAAQAQSVYLIRPDMHIAGRWHSASAEQIIAGYNAVIYTAGTT